MMRTILLFYGLAVFISASAMYKPLTENDWNVALKLATLNPSYEPALEQFFMLKVPPDKPSRDVWFIELQGQVHRKARGLRKPAPVQNCLLNHLMLVYYSQELESDQENKKTYQNVIKKIRKQLGVK